MVRSTALALSPATAAWGALVDLAARAQQRPEAPAAPDAQAALELARSAVPIRTSVPRRRRVSVPAGRVVEVLPGVRRGSPLLEPAPGSVPGIDEALQDLAVYRVHAAGTIDGRTLAEGARVVIARCAAGRGELVAVADRRAIRLCVVGASGLAGVPEGARVIGVVEAVIGEGQRRRCA